MTDGQVHNKTNDKAQELHSLLTELEKLEEILGTEFTRVQAFINAQAPFQQWRRRRTSGLILMILCLAALLFILAVTGELLDFTFMSGLFSNLFAETLGAALIFYLVDRLWQSGETNYRLFSEHNKLLRRFSRKLKTAQEQTNDLKEALMDLTKLTDPPDNLVSAISGRVNQHTARFAEIRGQSLQALEELVDLLDSLEFNRESERQVYQVMKIELEASIQKLYRQ